jgi:hypothetical protein
MGRERALRRAGRPRRQRQQQRRLVRDLRVGMDVAGLGHPFGRQVQPRCAVRDAGIGVDENARRIEARRHRQLLSLAPAVIERNGHGPDARHSQQGDHVLGVVAERHAGEVAPPDACVGQPEAQAVHHPVERRIGDAAVAAEDRIPLRTRPRVKPDDVRQRHGGAQAFSL